MSKADRIRLRYPLARRINWWPLRRRKQARAMQKLLMDIALLNRGTNFIGNLEGCIKQAKKLLATDYKSGAVSFTQFIDNTMFGDES